MYPRLTGPCINWTLGECVGSLTAHQDSVTSLSVDAAGLYLASGGTVMSNMALHLLSSFLQPLERIQVTTVHCGSGQSQIAIVFLSNL